MVAYPSLFLLLAGDGIRYLVGWYGYSAIALVLFISILVFIFRAKDKSSLRRFPFPLILLIGYMALSTIWSNYPGFSLLALATQLITTLSAVFLTLQFDWRQLLNLFANTIRLILGLSLVVELISAFTGPIRPIFANFEGDTPPSPAYWWVQGNLFQSERIQGFVGNANLLAYISVLGLVLFFVEYLVEHRNRRIPVISLFAAAGFLALAKSASMFIALLIVLAAAVVAMFAEGQPRSIRHRIYSRALWIALFVVFLAVAYWQEITDFLGKSSDASGRFDIWAKVWTLIGQRPLEGWGWISHWVPGVAPYEGLAVIDNVPYYHAHNAFLDVWLQLGIIGLIIFLWLLWSTFSRVWKIAVRHTNPLYLWPLFVFMVIVTQALSESRLLIENGWMLLVLLALKSGEPFENLGPVGITPKIKKLAKTISGPFGR